jgi:hypothetical protein
MPNSMHKRFSALASATLGACTSLLGSFIVLIAIDRRTYRPEKYYMRGAGPKWHEKHGRDGVSSAR